jgi:hypothetical protein
MDCVIPSHSIRTFCAAISCLSKIGKDLYVEFSPLDGLVTKSLNDAKSSYCIFSWQPSFFERCSAPPTTAGRKRALTDDTEIKYTCRIPLRALTAVVKQRRGVQSLRIRNETSGDHLYLSFEFRLQRTSSHHDELKIVHRLGVADAEGVYAVTSRDGASEIVAVPKVLLRMLEPLKQTTEMALIVNEKHKVWTR